MLRNDVIRAWGRILSGGLPSLSIEITRECPQMWRGARQAFDRRLPVRLYHGLRRLLGS